MDPSLFNAHSMLLEVLPVSGRDACTQRCRVCPETLETLGVRAGAAAWITTTACTGRVLCTLWPKSNNSTKYIQINDLVTSTKYLASEKCKVKEFVRFSHIEILGNVSLISKLTVTVVLESYEEVSKYKKCVKGETNLLYLKIKHLFQNYIVSRESVVNLYNTQIGREVGIYRVLIESLKTDRDQEYGIVRPNVEVIVNSVISMERYKQSQTNETKHRRQMGGLDREFKMLKELVFLPHMYRTNKLSLLLSRGILLQGPTGCGKTDIVHKLATDCKASLIIINGADVTGSRPGETEENLQKLFQKAVMMSQEGPCILFLDDLDVLCHRGSDETTGDSRVLSVLVQMLDRCTGAQGLTVIGATNRPAKVDPALRRSGRLEKKILLGIPILSARAQILRALTSDVQLGEDVDLAQIAEHTPGFVGADLVSLVQHAQYDAVQKNNICPQTTNHSMEPQIVVTSENFQAALHSVTPSSHKGSDITIDIKRLSWDDIGGLEDIKVKLKQAIEWPLQYPERFARLGVPRPKGVLLYGPPGCAKSSLVMAAANSCRVNFLTISGGQLYSPYVGDSELKLTQVFQQARASAPSVLFIDELDAVIGRRGKSECVKGVQERVLSTLLNELDGIGLKADDIKWSTEKYSDPADNAEVLIVAATNRPDMVDDAVMRPGRIDRIIYVPTPDTKTRSRILSVHTQKVPLTDVSLDELAEATEGFTGADLENLCREAVLHAMSVDGLNTEVVTREHFTHVLAKLQPSLSVEQIKQYNNLQHQFGLKSS